MCSALRTERGRFSRQLFKQRHETGTAVALCNIKQTSKRNLHVIAGQKNAVLCVAASFFKKGRGVTAKISFRNGNFTFQVRYDL